jgi:hypothetical protein
MLTQHVMGNLVGNEKTARKNLYSSLHFSIQL